MANVSITRRDSILDQLARVRRQIEQRAYELFRHRDGGLGDALGDWLTAEEELVRKPVMELREKHGVFTVVVAVAGIEPKDVNVEVTDQDMVIKGESIRRDSKAEGFERAAIGLFGSVHFPRVVDPGQAKADCRRGVLTITVPAAPEAKTKRVNVKAA